ncbi:MAG: alanine--tRNA ligase [Dehalococcoidia bacterium]|nr:alanine--tRNA ligase [Dehalococcoidia bacterium]
MTDDEIRSQYLSFFSGKGHQIIPSSSLIPRGDPTLLLTTAGMVQLKPYFMGLAKPPHTRLTSCQKCFRTTDIESVGDSSHLTFFEMLGNFSVGDYFKTEAIDFAWEFITVKLGIPKEKLWTTVYLDDDEAIQLWLERGVPAERIVRLGEEDNFWGPAGDSGPCGPCSEIHYDFGEASGCGKADCNPSCKCGRFCEIWNLVFVQYHQDKAGKRTSLSKPNIDTGMGLERITAIMQGTNTVYNTGIFRPLLRRAAELSGMCYGADEESDRAMRIISEHGRAVSFLIADGVMPSNDGRGYVLRRLLRRGVLFGRRLGLETPFLLHMAEAAIEQSRAIYPELANRRSFILDVVRREEEHFAETLNTGLVILDEIMARDDVKMQMCIAGEFAFKLYDTYGFPIEITREIASARGYKVDIDAFEREMDRQREKARSAHKFDGAEQQSAELCGDFEQTRFVGYKGLSASTRIAGIILDNENGNSVKAEQKAGLVLADTPFYAEMGGQVGDTGLIVTENASFIVTNTVRLAGNITLHQGYVAEGSLAVGDVVTAEVDAERRADIARNHTATHLLHAALRKVLGEHVQQGGSLVEPLRLRFDFSHLSSLTASELSQVRDMVNSEVRCNHPVYDCIMPYKEALASGATALFDEKYGDVVRVLSVGRPVVSAELCGGTHVAATGEIGFFEITGESSIGAGLRRIEAVTGRGAARLAASSIAMAQSLSKLLDTAPEDVGDKVQALIAGRDQEIKRAEALEREIALKEVSVLLTHVRDAEGVRLLAARVKPSRPETLRDIADALRNKLGSAIIVLGMAQEDKPYFVVTVTDDLVAKGYHAGNIIRQTAAITGGGGGGKPGMSQGGGKDVSKLDEAIASVYGLLKQK